MKAHATCKPAWPSCSLLAFPWLFRGFFVALFCLEKQCLGLFRGFFVVFSWFFRGPRFGQNLRVLALEQSSDLCCTLFYVHSRHSYLSWCLSIPPAQRPKAALAPALCRARKAVYSQAIDVSDTLRCARGMKSLCLGVFQLRIYPNIPQKNTPPPQKKKNKKYSEKTPVLGNFFRCIFGVFSGSFLGVLFRCIFGVFSGSFL